MQQLIQIMKDELTVECGEVGLIWLWIILLKLEDLQLIKIIRIVLKQLGLIIVFLAQQKVLIQKDVEELLLLLLHVKLSTLVRKILKRE
jgi:hypothetical protein